MCVLAGGPATDRGSVQLGPRDVHSCLSSSFRLSWSRDTAELVRAGLDTDAPRLGPPVVFTICPTPRWDKTCVNAPGLQKLKPETHTVTDLYWLSTGRHTDTQKQMNHNTWEETYTVADVWGCIFPFRRASIHKSNTPVPPFDCLWTDSSLNGF